MGRLIVAFLIIGLILAVIGLLAKGIEWLAAVGVLIFIGALFWEGLRRLIARNKAVK